MNKGGLTPSQALAELAERYDNAVAAQRRSLKRYLTKGKAPSPTERRDFRYPSLEVTYEGDEPRQLTTRAYGKFQRPGRYVTSVTHPHEYGSYLIDQMTTLVEEHGARIEVGTSNQEIPYPYVIEGAEAFEHVEERVRGAAQYFPTPSLSAVSDDVADGMDEWSGGRGYPLSLFDAPRTDYSLRRLVHYTGTPWTAFQSWILFTNYQRYVDEFVQWALDELRDGTRYKKLVTSGNVVIEAGAVDDTAEQRVTAAPWGRFQMPAYHLIGEDNHGVTLINIGVGPSNAKTITDHLAVLRPHCWIMIGHCGGLRQSQRIGDYVLAHAYYRQDHVLNEIISPDVPIPALAEIQTALQKAAAEVTGDQGMELKRRLRTGTVVTHDNRNWELQWSRERRRISLTRAIAIDMESGTVAAQGYRFRVPYGTLLCVSDKPLHGEIKLPGAANAFYNRAVGEHLQIGLSALDLLKQDMASLHSRKLRSFDEPPFR